MDQTTGAGKGSETNEAFLGMSLDQWWDILHPVGIIASIAGGSFAAMRNSTKKEIVKDLEDKAKEAIIKDLEDSGEKIPDEKTLNALATKAIKQAYDKKKLNALATKAVGQAMDQTTGAGKGNMSNESKSYRHTRLKKFGEK